MKIQGKYGLAKIHASIIDDTTKAQVEEIAKRT